MAYGEPQETLTMCLMDAIASERAFELRLRTFAREAGDPGLGGLFAQRADEARRQHERLASRLEHLGGTAQDEVPDPGGVPPAAEDRLLTLACTAENSEIATYEALAAAAHAAGDEETERLARTIQSEEHAAAEHAWQLLGPDARRSVEGLTLHAA